ncbi:GGDEF domain-containing protein [Glaciecola sp. XM2]|uniref:GGDEF domain-containing protein n=1 Tax=Glaciecola sp. XM2 TaxID=1914931 RepID=UPI001BDDF994|nr:GGDEF domain-containing protein [Glaciecola sp. XM2]MBT1450114.1 GGDEF domain-containing protein [Glaciecola sp. XM2]
MAGSRPMGAKADSIVFMILSAGISLGMLPFSLLRVLQEDWPIAILNVSAMLSTFALFLLVLVTRKTHHARTGLAVVTFGVLLGTVYLKGASNVLWVYPALTTAFYLLTPLIAACASLVCLVLVVLFIYSTVDFVFLMTFVVSAGATFLFLYSFSSRMREQAFFLTDLATTDPLTGVGNRRQLEERLVESVRRMLRAPEQTSSLIIFDIDHFKRINDQFGHGVGDQVLKMFADFMTKRIRKSDSFYRLGGEEFVLLLENTGLFEAASLARDITKEVSMADWGEIDIAITVSAGVAHFEAAESSYDWLDRADKALYRAKENGRNQCVVCNNEPAAFA